MSELTPEHRHLVDALLSKALDRDAAERRRWLTSLEDVPLAVRAEVESLLGHVSLDEGPMDPSSVVPALLAGELDEQRLIEPPERVGAYRIIQRIGEGTSGVVFEAEQDDPARRVAVKILYQPGRAARRFRDEIAILARLRHPTIAQVYDTGSFVDGSVTRPWFAMELVNGTSVIDWARDANVSIDDRVRLMAEVCEGVAHSHQRAVLHRDLKPAHILVDDEGRPRILDFGIGRILDDGTTRATEDGQVLGSLQYMSPEQASGDPLLVDTRSDVYALGAILYELLAGKPPVETSGMTLPTALRRVSEPKPAPLRSIDPRLRGDLDTVVGCAIAANAERRYASAAEFGADLRRFLADQPVLAHPPSVRYQLAKFAKRHRVAVVAIAVGLATFVAGAVLAAVFAFGQAVARRDAAAVTDHLRNMLAEVSPDRSGGDVRVREMLDASLADLEARDSNERPIPRASIADIIGEAYRSLRLYEQAERAHDIAYETRRDALGETHPDTIDSLTRLASSILRQGRIAEAEPLRERLVELSRSAYGDEHPQTSTAIHNLGFLRMEQSRFDDAEEKLMRAYELRLEHLGETHEYTVQSIDTIGGLWMNAGQPARAERWFARALDLRRQTLGADDLATINTLNNLGWVHGEMGRHDDAAREFEEAIELTGGRYGDDHPTILDYRDNLARAYEQLGRVEDAEAIYEDNLARRVHVHGEDHPETAKARLARATLWDRMGRHDDAIAELERAAAIFERHLGPDHSRTATALNNIGFAYVRQERYEQAVPALEDALARFERSLGPDHPETANTRHSLARCAFYLGHSDVAAASFELAWRARRSSLGPTATTTLASAWSLLAVTEAQERWDRTVALSDEMLADLRDDPERQRDLGHFLRKKGHAQLRSSHLAEARATLTESLEILDSVEGRSGRNALWVLDLLIEIAVTDGDAPAAERLELDRRERRGETG